MLEVFSSVKLPDWLRREDSSIFYLRTFPDCKVSKDDCQATQGRRQSPLRTNAAGLSFALRRSTTGAGRLQESSARFQTWGTVWNGLCLTAKISECPKQESGCSLSAILIPDAPERYYLSSEQVRKLLFDSSEKSRATRSILPRG